MEFGASSAAANASGHTPLSLAQEMQLRHPTSQRIRDLVQLLTLEQEPFSFLGDGEGGEGDGEKQSPSLGGGLQGAGGGTEGGEERPGDREGEGEGGTEGSSEDAGGEEATVKGMAMLAPSVLSGGAEAVASAVLSIISWLLGLMLRALPSSKSQDRARARTKGSSQDQDGEKPSPLSAVNYNTDELHSFIVLSVPAGVASGGTIPGFEVNTLPCLVWSNLA